MPNDAAHNPMPTSPPGADLAQLDVWQREVLTPWVLAQQRRQGHRSYNERDTPTDRKRAEGRAEHLTSFANQMAALDRASLIARLDEVDAMDLLNEAD